MKRILTIYLKELKDTLRDRRTIIMMLVIPLVFFPLIMTVMMKMTMSQQQKAADKVLNICVISNGNSASLLNALKEQKDIKINNSTNLGKIKELIKKDKIDFGIILEKNFDDNLKNRVIANIDLYYKYSSEMKILKKRISKLLNTYKENILTKRLNEINLSDSFIIPFNVSDNDLATQKEKIGENIGGILPYLFVVFSFLGAFYPAIDLAAGEKERGTIETLLVSPSTRLQIVIGKFLVVVQASLISALVGLFGMYIALQQMGDIPNKALGFIFKIFEFKSIALVFSLLLPVCIFFAAILLSLSIYAKSFKEAQSIMTPLNFIVFIPVIIGTLPGMKLDAVTAMIPILNVSLASKDILSGTIQTGLLLETYFSLFLLAAVSLYYCTKQFQREDIIFRGV